MTSWVVVNAETLDYFMYFRNSQPCFSTEQRDARRYTKQGKRDRDVALILKAGYKVKIVQVK